MTKKEYSNGEISIIWKPEKCIHAGVCVKTLPKVYKPKEHPWISPENASTDELIKQIDKCPSGALTYKRIVNKMEIIQINNDSRGEFKALDNGKEAGLMTYSWAGETKFIIDHTEVKPAYTGKGVGKQLVLKAVEYARANDLKIIALCPFAKAIFEKTKAIQDVLLF